jgi:hypothetical protein
MVVLRPNSDNDSLPSLCLLPYPIFPEPVVANDKRFMRKIEKLASGKKKKKKVDFFLHTNRRVEDAQVAGR